MIGTILHLFGNLFIGICVSAISLLFVSLAITIRLLPKFLSFSRLCLRGFLILSFRLYKMILTPISNPLERMFNINILSNLPRVVATMMLSVTGYLFIVHLTKLNTPDWLIALAILHGLTVGVIWGGLMQPGGLQLGVDIQ